MNVIPEQLYRAEQVRELDRRAIEGHGIPGFALMQRAAQASFEILKCTWPEARRLHVLCGPGNNGGDGLVLASMALAEEFHVSLELLCKPDDLKGDAAKALELFHEAGGQLESGIVAGIDAEVVVDALLGTGANRAVAGDFLNAIERINLAQDAGAGVISLDIPSGLHADTGAVLGVAVKSTVTVSFIGMKPGLLTGAGPEYAGELHFSHLDVPGDIYDGVLPSAQLIPDGLRQKYLKPRSRDAHKNRHGHLLCIGGDYATAGAIRLAAEAALRSGAGLVSVATRPEVAVAMSQACPELMCSGVETANDLISLLAQSDAVLIGPGLGQEEWGQSLWSKVMESDLPVVVDADGLNLLSANRQSRDNWVLTPHPGEAARLLNVSKDNVQADRAKAVTALAEQFGAITLLKGAGSMVTQPESPVFICQYGNPGMAVGGMGDLLGGIIVSLIAQGVPLMEATCIAVDIHARAGDLAAVDGERGLLPHDLFPLIRQLVNP